MNVLAIIPARRNSVSIPRKNMILLRNKPLIGWTIEAAKHALKLNRIVVSTDCYATASYAEQLGVQVIMRPDNLADGSAHPGRIAEQVIESFQKPDAIMWLQPTSPLRTAKMIDDAVTLMEVSGADSVVSYTDVREYPEWMATIEDDGRVRPHGAIRIRQEMPKFYLRSGDIYLTKTDILLKRDLYGEDCRALIIPRERWCNINEPVDLKIAEALL